jgi:hypothetical protein
MIFDYIEVMHHNDVCPNKRKSSKTCMPTKKLVIIPAQSPSIVTFGRFLVGEYVLVDARRLRREVERRKLRDARKNKKEE